METSVVQVPVSLLSDTAIPPSAKKLWMIMRLDADLDPVRPVLLARRSGLSYKTVITNLAHLAANGWYAASSGGLAAIHRIPSVVGASIPGPLLADRRLGVHSLIVYAYLQVTRDFRHPVGQFTYKYLSRLTKTSLPTVRRAVRELAESGWLRITQVNQLAPVHFSLCNPGVLRGEAEVAMARVRLNQAPFYGEALMREYLSLLIDSEQFEDDAAPGFLVNPLSNERMQLDRYYPPAVAFEFNGPQHYHGTDRFSEQSAAKQRGRDYIKLGICTTRGINLVVIHPEDLRLETVQQKVGQLLPIRDLNGHELLVAFLQSVSRRYRLAAKRGGNT